MQTKLKLYQVLSIVVFIGVVVMNYLANALPLNNKTTGELSDMYPNLFTPAGFTFSIWGVIYTALVVYVIYQARTLFNKTLVQRDALVAAIAPWFLLSCLFNALWIVVWHYQFTIASIFIMIGILYSLYRINALIYREEQSYQLLDRQLPGLYFFKIPFGLYFGWIIVATAANATAVLVDINWTGFGLTPMVWCLLLLIIATLITAFTVNNLRNGFVGLSVIWALFGIVYKRFDRLIEEPYTLLPYAGIACMVVLVIVVIIVFTGQRKRYSVEQR